MAEITEVFEDFTDNVKKTVKNKPFVLAAGAVALVGLFVWWKKQKTASSGTTAYEAIGYGGYPETSGSLVAGGGGGSDDSALYEQLIYENSAYYEKLLGDMDSTYSTELTDLSERVSLLLTSNEESEQRAATYEASLKREQTISQMRANSELYNVITDRATKDALHAENMALAESMGWAFDSTTGNYYDGNSVVYTTSKQQAGVLGLNTNTNTASSKSYVNNQTYNNQVTNSVLKSTQSSNKGYDPNIDYSLAIKEAQQSGADAATITALQVARQAKIDDVYGGIDPDAKSTSSDSTVSVTTSKTDPSYQVVTVTKDDGTSTSTAKKYVAGTRAPR